MMAGVLVGINVLLAAALTVSALRPRPVVVLPSAKTSAELLPGAVPEETAREFALRYVLHFDNFTPSTLDATHLVLQRMIGARSWSGRSRLSTSGARSFRKDGCPHRSSRCPPAPRD
jgi:hypothetical protein